jgi:hypothetical protein
MAEVDWKALKNVATPIPLDPDPGYKYLATYVTGVADPVYPWNERDVLEIRRMIGNDFIPVTRRAVYRSPAGAILTYVHLGAAMHVANRSPEPQFQGILMPTGARWPRPNVMGFWFEPSDKTRFERMYGLPARTVAWGRWVVQMAEEAKTLDAKEAKEVQRKRTENSEEIRALAAAKEEAAYRQREEAHRQREAIGSMSSSELVEFGQMLNGSYQRPEFEPKPFVHLQG